MKSDGAIVNNSAASDFKSSAERVKRFLFRLVGELREEGWPALLRNGLTAAQMMLAVPVLLVVRALRPLVVIRFGPLESRRIGHFAAYPELYLCRRDTGMHGSRKLDIFYHLQPVSNQQLKKMWDRTLHVSRFARTLDVLNRAIPDGASHIIPMPPDNDILGPLGQALSCTPAHLVFTSEEEQLGRDALRGMGIPEGNPLVCFHARDSAYLDALFPSRNWRYHDYRNSSIHNYVAAVEDLTRRGYFAIRMGARVGERLSTTNPRIIDYTTNGRTDFLDIYLSAKCRFFICDTAGIFAIPKIFRRPLAGVNFVPLSHASALSMHDLYIPKKLWLRAERRLMTFREILACGADKWALSQLYVEAGIEVIDNTPDEILALADEMNERLNGHWVSQGDDDELQERYRALLPQDHPIVTYPSGAQIGAAFLRENRAMLE